MDVVVSTADDSSVGIVMNTLHVHVHQYNKWGISDSNRIVQYSNHYLLGQFAVWQVQW